MKAIALDIETTGLNPRLDRIHGIGIAYYSKQKENDDPKKPNIVTKYKEANDEEIKDILSNPENHIVGHNIRFDLRFLINNGFDVKAQIWDTKLMAQLVDENRHLGLKDLVKSDNLQSKKDLDRQISSLSLHSVADLCRLDLDNPNRPYFELISRYCKEDCRNTLELFKELCIIIDQKHKNMLDFGFTKTLKTYLMEEARPLEGILLNMELEGIKVKKDDLLLYRDQLVKQKIFYITQLNELCKEQINNIEGELYEKEKEKRKSEIGKQNVKRKSERYKTHFNWQSAQHLSSLIFDQFGVSKRAVDKTKTGMPSTSEESLENLRKTLQESDPLYKVLDIYKDYKKNQKLITTYTGEDKGLLSQIEDGRVYSEYLQAGSAIKRKNPRSDEGGTITGRLSSKNPNMQNFPRECLVKKFFVPDTEDDVFVYFDYSQLELRIAAHISKDPLLMQAYNDNLDLHQITADAIKSDRQVGKTTNFAMIYDASAYRLSDILDKSIDEAQEIINNFYGLYSGYKKYLQQQLRFMITNGFVVSDAGRVRRLPEIRELASNTKEWKHAVKQGYNFPIQSLGASITKRAMIELHHRKFKLVTTVHDSVVIQLPKTQLHKVEEIQHVAENIYSLSVPLKVDIKVLTSLLESDKVNIEGVNHEQYSDSKQNKGSI